MTDKAQHRQSIFKELQASGFVIETLPGCIRLNGPYNSRILFTDVASLPHPDINRLSCLKRGRARSIF
jgi:hypothetical protein